MGRAHYIYEVGECTELLMLLRNFFFPFSGLSSTLLYLQPIFISSNLHIHPCLHLKRKYTSKLKIKFIKRFASLIYAKALMFQAKKLYQKALFYRSRVFEFSSSSLFIKFRQRGRVYSFKSVPETSPIWSAVSS